MNTDPTVVTRLLEIATAEAETRKTADWRTQTVEERIVHAVIAGVAEFIETDVEEAR